MLILQIESPFHSTTFCPKGAPVQSDMYFDHICNWIISTHKIRSISCPTPTPILSSLVQFWQYIFKSEIPEWWCLCSLPHVSGVVWSKLGCPPFAPSPYQPPCPAWHTDTGVLLYSSSKGKSAHLIRGTRLLRQHTCTHNCEIQIFSLGNVIICT